MIKETLRIAADDGGLLFMIQETLAMVKESSFQDGRKEQSKKIVNALRLELPVNF